jgi:histidinol dehydrogenase
VRALRAGTEGLDLWLRDLEARRAAVDEEARRAAAEIVERVRTGGDAACAELVRRFDGVEIAPEELRVAPREASVPAALAEALAVAAGRIAAFHEPQAPRGFEVATGASVLRHEVRPLGRVGVYVPGGAATYVSTLLMCAIPARIAGVREVVVATTPRAAASAELNYVCRLLGVGEIYRAGGAAGVAALAYGTESLRRVDKIVGPGNRFVAAAKQLVATAVGVDLVAGPSEIVVLADDTADPSLVAADLLAQGEHGPDSTPVCVTTSDAFAARLRAAVLEQLEEGEGARAALEANGAIVVARDLAEAASVVDRLAPEHLEIQVARPDLALALVENAAAIYVGAGSGVALGDYAVGTNHVLPTAGSARFSSPLGVADFVRRRSVVHLDPADAAALGAVAATIATAEGLPLHARSCAMRAGR